MIIYPLDQQIEELFADNTNADTGELTCTEDEMLAKIEAAKMDFAAVIRNLRNEYINKTAEAEALKAEKISLGDRQKTAENAAGRAKRWLAYLTKGEKYTDGIVKISYRKSEALVIDDRESLLAWAKDHNQFLKEPELREADIKAQLKMGQAVPFTHLETRQNVQVK